MSLEAYTKSTLRSVSVCDSASLFGFRGYPISCDSAITSNWTGGIALGTCGSVVFSTMGQSNLGPYGMQWSYLCAIILVCNGLEIDLDDPFVNFVFPNLQSDVGLKVFQRFGPHVAKY